MTGLTLRSKVFVPQAPERMGQLSESCVGASPMQAGMYQSMVAVQAPLPGPASGRVECRGCFAAGAARSHCQDGHGQHPGSRAAACSSQRSSRRTANLEEHLVLPVWPVDVCHNLLLSCPQQRVVPHPGSMNGQRCAPCPCMFSLKASITISSWCQDCCCSWRPALPKTESCRSFLSPPPMTPTLVRSVVSLLVDGTEAMSWGSRSVTKTTSIERS